MLPDAESLRCFVAAAEQLNFRAAARRVALSPAAFGGRIKQLENQLGSALFARSTRRVALTPAGERLLPHARDVLAGLGRCLDLSSDKLGAAPFALVIGTRFELGLSFIVPSLAALEAARPERQLHVYFGDSADLMPRVLRQEIDCMVTSARLSAPGLAHAPLHEERYALVAARSLLARAPLRRPADAASHVLLDAHPDLPLFRYFVDARPGGESWAFRHVQLLGTIAAIRARALEGAGVAVLPMYFVANDLARGRLVRLFAKTRMAEDRFRLSWRAGHVHARELQALAVELAARPLR
jgi:LysR family transcriptional regulator, glycine cleavage system transcriptional activator